MTTNRDARSLARSAAAIALVLSALWVVVVVVTGGFSVSIGGRIIASHEPMRPLYWSILPLAVFVWANGVDRTARTWSSWIARIDHRVAAGVLTVGTLAIGVTYATTSVVGSDAYGYVSEADLWLRSDLRVPQPWVAEVPWPNAALTFSPLAYRPAGTGSPTDLVPVYSPGLPLLMAAAKRIGGHPAVFLVVPIAGALLVLATWGIGRRLGSSSAGLIAALFVASSPTVLFMLAMPMSDVPAAACWAVGFYLLLRPGVAVAVGAGVAAGLTVLIRPNLIWLAGPPVMWLLWRAIRPAPESRGVALARLVGFSLGVIASAAFIAIMNARLYGSPLRSGYGDLGPLFSASNVGINAHRYLSWLVASQTPLIVIGLAAVVWPARQIWPEVRDRTIFWVAGACVVGLWIFYLFYLPFDEWWFLRFLLISWPFIMLGLAAVIVAVARWSPVGLIVCTVLVVLLGIREFNDSRIRGAFGLWRSDREFVAAALATRETISPTSVVFSQLHSGSVRYYGGRMTIEYVWMDEAWLDRAIAWLDAHGAPSFALLSREEVGDFKARFSGSATVARLDAHPVFEFQETGLALYALSTPFSGPTQALQFNPHALRSVPPVTPSPFGFR
jgi:4-amino-4-deoxy-L-arabinose transferase-like glycosyltransferase